LLSSFTVLKFTFNVPTSAQITELRQPCQDGHGPIRTGTGAPATSSKENLNSRLFLVNQSPAFLATVPWIGSVGTLQAGVLHAADFTRKSRYVWSTNGAA